MAKTNSKKKVFKTQNNFQVGDWVVKKIKRCHIKRTWPAKIIKIDGDLVIAMIPCFDDQSLEYQSPLPGEIDEFKFAKISDFEDQIKHYECRRRGLEDFVTSLEANIGMFQLNNVKRKDSAKCVR